MFCVEGRRRNDRGIRRKTSTRIQRNVKPILVALIVVGAVSHRASAQAVAPAGVVNRPVAADTTPRFTSDDSFLIRSLTGALGFMGGAAAGLGLAVAMGPYDCSGCDDRVPVEAAAGIVLGGVLGASFGASAPKLRGKCSFGARLLRSTAGSVVGGAVGAVISLNAGSGDGVVVGLPLGAVLGASAALSHC